MEKHTILFLAANPEGSSPLALDREAHAIQAELERAAFRDQFDFVTRWAIEPMDLLRELRKIRPTVVHFSGHGQRASSVAEPGGPARRDLDQPGSSSAGGLHFHAPDGGVRRVSAAAIEQTFGAAGSSVRLVVLNACYTAAQAEALISHVDFVVGMSGAMGSDAARHFAVGFYGGLGERESVAAAYRQGKAAICLEGLPESELPQLRVRTDMDAERIVLGTAPAMAGSGEVSEQGGRGQDLGPGGGASPGPDRRRADPGASGDAAPGPRPIANARRSWALRMAAAISATCTAGIPCLFRTRRKHWVLAGGAIAVFVAAWFWNLPAVLRPGDGTPPFAILVPDLEAAAMLSPAREGPFTYVVADVEASLSRSGIILGAAALPAPVDHEYRQIVHDGFPLGVRPSGTTVHVLVKYEGAKHCEIDINLMEKRIWRVHLAPFCD